MRRRWSQQSEEKLVRIQSIDHFQSNGPKFAHTQPQVQRLINRELHRKIGDLTVQWGIPGGRIPAGYLAEMESQGRYRKNQVHNLNIKNFPYIKLKWCLVVASHFPAKDDH